MGDISKGSFVWVVKDISYLVLKKVIVSIIGYFSLKWMMSRLLFDQFKKPQDLDRINMVSVAVMINLDCWSSFFSLINLPCDLVG